MARLYPPVTEEVLSAFCLNYNDNNEKVGASININFNLNKAVANTEIAGIALRLRTISTNKYVITENINVNPNTGKSEGIALSYSLEDGTCTFIINAENNEEAINNLKVGQFYKAQLAFIGLTGTIGYWSTVATIKCVAKPSVTIANYTANDANIFTNEILGEYIQDTSTGDSSEKVYSYRFQLFDSQNNLLDDTGIQLHNSSFDTSSNSSTDSYYCYQELNEGESYYLVYSITTINGLSISSPRYQVITVESIDPEDDITLMVSNGAESEYKNQEIPNGGFPTWAPWEEGLIRIYPDLNGNIEKNMNADGSNKTISGNFVVLRSSSKDNFHTWQEVKRFRLNDEVPSNKLFYDYTVEQGITYRYAIQQFNRQQFYSKKVYSYKRNPIDGSVLYENAVPIFNDIVADFEDMFLYDGQRQLKIRFNPQVTSFKNDLQEQKIDTIGSKHPFIFRNGNVCYKEFPISGLISFQLDNAKFFINDEDYAQMNLGRFEQDQTIRDKDKNIFYQKLTYSELIDAINNNIQLYRYVETYEDTLKIDGHENKMSNNSFLSEEEKQLLLNNNSNVVLQKRYVAITSATDAKSYFDQGWNIYKKLENVIDDPVNNTRKNINYIAPTIYSKNNLTSDNIMSERYFKLLVLDWLTDGKPKLFRSPTEGNYIVRLLNVSLTPKTELGRMIHEFTCTAYEVADFNYQSLLDLGLLTIEDPNELEKQWFSKDIRDLFDEDKKTVKGYYNIELGNNEIIGFKCTGFAPGDKIQIVTKNSATPIDITIGTTGTYIYDEGKSIINIAILPINNSGDFSRNVLLASQGYSSQKFDTVAAINTHTKIGEQLIGPIDNFLEQTTVGTGLYYQSPNVNLIEDDGVKLRVSEILHLHAKRREVIPIFYNKYTSGAQNNISVISGDRNNLPTFSLTPFGLGYIKSKSILPNPPLAWNVGLGNLTEEELVKEREIQDLVDFVISKCNKDIFCLFEVQFPKVNDETGLTEWVPYSSVTWSTASVDYGAKIYGIYDPWLYEQQTLKMSLTNQSNYKHLMGWWPKQKLNDNVYSYKDNYGEYNPTLTFRYGEEEVIISLADKIEISLDNIKVPDSITIGNGVIMEPIYRLQQIDYTIENERPVLKDLRNNYLALQRQAINKFAQYRSSIYVKQIGEALIEKYNNELLKIQDYKNYKNIVALLTERARQEQIEKLSSYFSQENSLIDIVLLQLKDVDLDLINEIGLPYENNVEQRIYHPEYGLLVDAKNAYDDFFIAGENFELINENLVPIILDKDSVNSSSIARENINNLIKHINNSYVYNFANVIETLRNRLTPNIATTVGLITDLENNIYVSQYLELLDEKGKDLFFSPIVWDNIRIETLSDGTTTTLDTAGIENIPTYNLIFKQNTNINDLQYFNITNPIWEDYFHFGNSEENTLVVLELIPTKVNDITQYFIVNFNKYYPTNTTIHNDCLLRQNSSFLINTIANNLNNLNNALQDGGTQQQRMEEYNIYYTPVNYSSGNPNTTQKRNQILLGSITSSNNINQNNQILENIINNIYLSNPNATIGDITSGITQQSIFYNLPKVIQDILITKDENQQIIDGYIIEYITKDNETNKSPRDIYQEILACVVYRDTHLTELSQGQIQVINDTINDLKQEEPYRTFVQHNHHNSSTLYQAFTKWNQDYSNVSNGADVSRFLSNLEKCINTFNSIIRYKFSLINTFKNYRDRYIQTLNTYDTSDNIKEILWEERTIYQNATDKLTEIRDFFNTQLTYYQDAAIFEGYLDFLNSYLEYKDISMTNDKAKYLQLLTEAQAMANTVIDENNNLYNLRLEVEQAWKVYLDTLAQVYQTEVKERFG